jgi:endonuclease/exonuclease/phosphatase family metal-dependent hydrolase
MGLRWLSAVLLVTVVMASGCSEKPTTPKPAPLPSPVILGGASTLEIMTWNIEWFPKAGQSTIDMVVGIIDSLEVDLIAVQEIADTTAFRTLIQSLDGYQGIFSPDTYGDEYQKTGILYRESVVTVETYFPILEGDFYAFPRPPMKFHLVASKDDVEFEFRLVVLHLKAGGDPDDLARRQDAAEKLKNYLDDRLQYDEVKDYIVAGDWNDQVDDPPFWNAFNPLIQSGDYRFITATLATSSYNDSHPPTRSLIDHILISAEVEAEYYYGRAYTQRLEAVWEGYEDIVSDHRPVMAVFPIF